MAFDRRVASEWATIIGVPLTVAIAIAPAIGSWSGWKSYSALDYTLFGAVVVLAATSIGQTLRMRRLRKQAEARVEQENAARERARSSPSANIIVDLAQVGVKIDGEHSGNIYLIFKINSKSYPDPLFLNGFAVSDATFGAARLVHAQAADPGSYQLPAIGHVPVVIPLTTQHITTILSTLPPEYPDEPRNLATAHMFAIEGVFKLRDETGRDRPLSVNQTVSNAIFQLQLDGPIALQQLRARVALREAASRPAKALPASPDPDDGTPLPPSAIELRFEARPPYQYFDGKMSHHRLGIRNCGTGVIDNVKVELVGINPVPKAGNFSNDFPYPVRRASEPLPKDYERIDSRGVSINSSDEELFELLVWWNSSDGRVIVDALDTKPVQWDGRFAMEHESWSLSYRISAARLEAIRARFHVVRTGDSVVMERVATYHGP